MMIRNLAVLLLPLLVGIGVVFAGTTAAPKATPATNVHKTCINCHPEGTEKESGKIADIDRLCLKCHPLSLGRDHATGIVATIIPEGLPLGEGNKITCITCHEPHGKDTVNRLLRKDPNKLCIACHTDKEG